MKYLVISHGPMAKGAVDSVEMILGHQSHVFNLSVTNDSTIMSTLEEIEEVIGKYAEEEWVILTDIIGGTPFNAAYHFLSKNDSAIIVTGFNLPLLISLFMQTDLTLANAIEFIQRCQPETMSIVDKVEVKQEVQDYDL